MLVKNKCNEEAHSISTLCNAQCLIKGLLATYLFERQRIVSPTLCLPTLCLPVEGKLWKHQSSSFLCTMRLVARFSDAFGAFFGALQGGSQESSLYDLERQELLSHDES